jgi:hypothetical protein
MVTVRSIKRKLVLLQVRYVLLGYPRSKLSCCQQQKMLYSSIQFIVYLGSMCTAVLNGWDLEPPPAFGLIFEGAYWSGQERRNLFLRRPGQNYAIWLTKKTLNVNKLGVLLKLMKVLVASGFMHTHTLRSVTFNAKTTVHCFRTLSNCRIAWSFAVLAIK